MPRATFKKLGGKIYGLLVREWLESLPDGAYCVEIERVDVEKRSNPANRLYWGAICQALAEWSASTGKGNPVSQDRFHKFFKDTCLPVILDQRKPARRVRHVLPSGRVMFDNCKPENSTTVLTPSEFTRYVALCCQIAREPVDAHGLGYPYPFDFANE
jgi:hypothetical protein